MKTTAFFNSETYEPKEIIAGHYPLVTAFVTILAGQVLSTGAVLGKITASSKFVLSASASSDGSQTPSVILVEDVDATDGDVRAAVYLSGEFLGKTLTLGTGHTLDSIAAVLRDANIYIK